MLLAVAMAVSGYGFWRRFGKVLKLIQGAKKDANFELGDVARRAATFVWEVLLQAKVITQRPLPGFAHAFVFWGFCAFALVTLNHFALGFGFELISPSGFFGRIYFGFAAAFSVVVAISILALAFRRFVLRPRWLGKVSYESGFIALLIFTLMWTYLADYLLHGQDPNWSKSAAARGLWWLHSACILVFLPLIPHTKHLHLILSPAAVFFKRDGFSKIPPLVGDEDFGLDTGKDLTRLVALQAFSCVECGRCTEHCPANNTGKLLNPKEIILGVRSYLDEFGPASEQPLLGKYLSQEAVFQCTTCGACEYQCPVGVQHLPILIGLRRGATNTGKWEDDYGNKLFLNLERYGNPLGFSPSEREKFLQKLGVPIFDGTQEYCLWLGCMGAYDPQGKEIISALVEVLSHLGVSYGVLRKERCTGDAARRLGNDLTFGQLAEANLEVLRSSKAVKLLSICPHCVRTLGEDYQEFGASLQIEHHSEFLARHRDKLPKHDMDRKVVFHDPCYLGRYRGVYDEPRTVASLGGLVVDPPRARERSFCCGAGGGLAFLGEEKGARVNVTRAEELLATGAQVVAAACPFCNTMFRDALGTVSKAPPALMDVAQLAAEGLRQKVDSRT
ncbi:MAG: heterodisulfide reductase-related iron-sulfur binding cluster [Bryobacteraceae bacterium]|nr:heterodisulfide reductase-related iron-sulfur binding cluster [Bryobacteraceae bacterium]MDW8379017.1 heterodisulfide reductase-related iron-sulfur binding cluster [Bryobacterales bacterium]